jgi:hypothetical protein
MFNQVFEIAQSAKQTMQQHEGFPFAFFNEFKFAVLLYFVTHSVLPVFEYTLSESYNMLLG